MGRVERGEVKVGMPVVVCSRDGSTKNARITKLFQYQGLKKVEAETAKLGDIIAVAGITDLNIGETACAVDCVEPLPFVKIENLPLP